MAHAPPISLETVTEAKLTPIQAKIHIEAVADLLRRNSINFPGAQPVSFARHHLQELQKRDYFMCEKTDGVRCLLYLTQEIGADGQPMEAQFLITRKNEYFFVGVNRLHIPNQHDMYGHHTGTLLDGELVQQRFRDGREQRTYLIFDLLAIDGEEVMNKTFDKRLARVKEFIEKPLRAFMKKWPDEVAQQPFVVEMKQMEFPYGMDVMFKEKIPKLPHGNDGLIFTCRETKYVSGTDNHILKWKPPHENTIDYRLIIGGFPWVEDSEDEQAGGYEDWDAMPTTELWVNHAGRGPGAKDEDAYKYFANLMLTDAEWAALKRLNQQIDGRIIECYRDPTVHDQDVWRPKLDGATPRFRDDKTDANHINVVISVMESIRDAVTEDDLILSAGAIRTKYKERQSRVEAEAKRNLEEEKRRRAEMGKVRQQQQQQQQVDEREVDEDDGQPRYED